jgi:hypothetical protein
MNFGFLVETNYWPELTYLSAGGLKIKVSDTLTHVWSICLNIEAFKAIQKGVKNI